MKIFISWSGEFSQKVASELKEWLPCVIQSIEVFFSTDDIEKGEKWDNKISSELNECKFGIVCLTNQNVNAPWIHFEAGALSKTLDSKVSALMLNVNPSDIKGPLSRFQATKFAKDDFYKLLQTINNNNDTKLDEVILRRTFDAMWEKLNLALSELIKVYNSENNNQKKDTEINSNGQAIEEILQILREQNSIISNPERLLPIGYFEYINESFLGNTTRNNLKFLDDMCEELYGYLNFVFKNISESSNLDDLSSINVIHLLDIISKNIELYNNLKLNKKWMPKFFALRKKYGMLIYSLERKSQVLESAITE